jgi:hypothetical protein
MGFKKKLRSPTECRKSGDRKHKGYFWDDGRYLHLKCWRCGAEVFTDSEFEEIEVG